MQRKQKVYMICCAVDCIHKTFFISQNGSEIFMKNFPVWSCHNWFSASGPKYNLVENLRKSVHMILI